MNTKEWRRRFKYRGDLSSRVAHLTKGVDEDEAFYNLMSILEKKKIYGSTKESGYIRGEDIPAVCLQEAPLVAIAENLQYEEMLRQKNGGKIRYMGFGVRFQKSFIFKKGGRPVIYDVPEQAERYLLENEYWRIVKLNLFDENHIVDWTHEREWRVPNFLEFKYCNCEILLPSSTYYQKFIKYCLENDRTDILCNIKGIIVINSVYY